ncbi:hypothetical protein PoB_001511000 [Plakobranchus ocellatus]|uniref:Uncharacterized protein n=1 Tax=Plakobranchus ocellatus TaxID=259542 RepID=A0AAV3Z080_9GAST|nr:hypothetical protein PoB_001511000 [Plakobranchus ocellatus]
MLMRSCPPITQIDQDLDNSRRDGGEGKSIASDLCFEGYVKRSYDHHICGIPQCETSSPLHIAGGRSEAALGSSG